jgi:hypothetical protein
MYCTCVNNRSEKKTVHDSSCSNQQFRNSFLEIRKNVIYRQIRSRTVQSPVLNNFLK